MRAEFSEFTFGFSLVRELAAALNCCVAPVFPSLVLEGAEGGGYDLHMDLGAVPFYLQFKLSEHLKTNNAKEAKLAPELISAPYRRFQITSSATSNQHEMLIGLNTCHDHVYYAAPNFYTNQALNQFWQNGYVADQTVYVKPSEIGALDDGFRHAVCFNNETLHQDTTYVFSKPKPVTAHSLMRLRHHIDESLQAVRTPLSDLIPIWTKDLDTAREEGERLHRIRVDAIAQQRDADRQKQSRDDDISVVRYDYVQSLGKREPFPQEGLPPVTRIARPQPATEPRPEDLALSAFGRRVATEFHAQAFILQRRQEAFGLSHPASP